MAVNKLALIRYKTIDTCLQNHFRKWTLDDLMEACADALYEYEGIRGGVSRRTIQLDLQNMRSEKLGYNAPIVVTEKKYYSYEEKGYSITNSPVTQQDLGTLNQVLGVLKQFKGFAYFRELQSMVTRLEDKLYEQEHNGQSYIDFETNELLKGLEFIDPIHQAIVSRTTIEIQHKSFKATAAASYIFFPYLLKEYRNRWFVLGKSSRNPKAQLLALDRIEAVRELPHHRYVKPQFDVLTYFDDVIGVSKVQHQQAQLIVFRVHPQHAPYVVTKPLHKSQRTLKQDRTGTIFSIEVIWNFELERELLGYGENVQVLSPKRLVNKMRGRLNRAAAMYENQ